MCWISVVYNQVQFSATLLWCFYSTAKDLKMSACFRLIPGCFQDLRRGLVILPVCIHPVFSCQSYWSWSLLPACLHCPSDWQHKSSVTADDGSAGDDRFACDGAFCVAALRLCFLTPTCEAAVLISRWCNATAGVWTAMVHMGQCLRERCERTDGVCRLLRYRSEDIELNPIYIFNLSFCI